MRTPLCDLLGIEVPIVQAPIGSASWPALAAAVSNAGALGMLAASWLGAEQLRAAIRATRALTQKPFGINLVLEWPQDERLALALEEGVHIVSFFWGAPAAYLPRVRAAGAVALHSVGSSAEARRAAEAGVDAI